MFVWIRRRERHERPTTSQALAAGSGHLLGNPGPLSGTPPVHEKGRVGSRLPAPSGRTNRVSRRHEEPHFEFVPMSIHRLLERVTASMERLSREHPLRKALLPPPIRPHLVSGRAEHTASWAERLLADLAEPHSRRG
jgi:hypothetical protein